jgi:hypothetical protein
MREVGAWVGVGLFVAAVSNTDTINPASIDIEYRG